MSLLLGVNVDHVATLRQARYALLPNSPNAEPSPTQAAMDSISGGADSITIHVRADRRHMQDLDAYEIRREISVPLNLEMGLSPEMLTLALDLKPDFVCLVPETREEVTTEGGLDVAARLAETCEYVKKLQAANILVSLFIDPDLAQIDAAIQTGAEMIELHTGCFANATGAAQQAEIERLKNAAIRAHQAKIQVNAGHGINYQNLHLLFAVPHLAELNIGHSIIARALRVGLTQAVREMFDLMAHYPQTDA